MQSARFKPSVYVETTIPSYYFETRTDSKSIAWRHITRRWWRRHRHAYVLSTSAITRAEVARAPSAKAAAALTLLQTIRDLPGTPEVFETAQYYMDHRLMPDEAAGDAAHLAFASIYRIDFLLTWNCRHLANANKIQHVAVLNRRLGLHVPAITTPMALIAEGSQ